MRVAGSSYINTLTSQLNLLQGQQYKLQNQISTGQRVQAPEDDPVAMETTLNLQTESNRVSQYAQTINTLQDRAMASFQAMTSLKGVSDRAGEIATQADGTESPQDLQTLATEVKQMIQTAVQVLNSKSGDQYLFGGTAASQPPYTMQTDANGNVTSVTYQGNTGQAQNDIAEGSSVTVDVVGENTSGTGPLGLITDPRSGADFFNHLISLQNHLLAGDANSVTTTDLPALKSDEDNIIGHIGDNGAVQTRLNTAATQADSRLAALKQTMSNTSGADMAQALTDLSQSQNAYQAALKSSSVILQMQGTLLNFIS